MFPGLVRSRTSFLAVVFLGGLLGCVDLAPPSQLTDRRDGFTDPARTPPKTDGSAAGTAGTGGSGGTGGTAVPPDRERLPDAAVVDAPADAEPDPSYPDALLANGQPCASGGQCSSGSCIDGVCCATGCTGTCVACNVTGKEGTCTAVAAGEDPADDCPMDPAAGCQRDGACDGNGGCRLYPAGAECAAGRCEGATEYAARTCDGKGSCQGAASKSCAPNVCMGSSCASRCTSATDCQTGFFCDGGACKTKRLRGAACTAAVQCANGNCADGVCCDLPCNQTCYACNVSGRVGTCTAVPTGQDPRNQCPAQAASTCGRMGACNGMGACRLHPMGTVCAAGSCSNAREILPRTCNGLGVCGTPRGRDCPGTFACMGTTCATRCTDNAHCKPGNVCSQGSCGPALPPPPPPPDAGADTAPPPPPPPAGPVLHWKMDEASGAMATDASGNNFHGTYLGTMALPLPSMMVPPVMFPNPRSRDFVRAETQYVRLTPMPMAVKPTAEISLSIWYRATTVDGSDPGFRAASELVSGAGSYMLRLLDTEIELLKRVTGASGGISFVRCYASAANALDGNWHHVAGVSSAAGLKVYVDGAERCSNTEGQPITYDAATPALSVGRYRDPEGGYLFQGSLDDLRIYARALTPAEVMALAAGRN